MIRLASPAPICIAAPAGAGSNRIADSRASRSIDRCCASMIARVAGLALGQEGVQPRAGGDAELVLGGAQIADQRDQPLDLGLRLRVHPSPRLRPAAR